MNIEKLSQQADTTTPPDKTKAKIKRRIMLSAPTATAVALTASRFTHQPLIVLAVALAAALYTAQDLIRLMGAASERRTGIETELPFTATIIAMAANHTTPINALKNTLGKPSLKNTAREYYNIIKHARLNHTTPANAASILANNHPSQRFQAFLRAVSAAERGVGDPQASLTDLAKAELENLHHQVEVASEKLGVASSTILMMFAVLPLTITVFSVIANQPSLIALSYTLALPSLLLVNFLVENAYPSIFKPRTSRPPTTTLLIASATTIAAYLAARGVAQPQYILAACLIAATAPIALYYYRTTQKTHAQLLASLPHLSRDIAEEAKKGLPPTVALRKLLASKKYPVSLRHTLTQEGKPRVAQAYMDVLSEAENIGADPDQLENIAQTFNSIANTHSSYLSKSSFFRLTAYASAAILAAASLAVTGTMKRLAVTQQFTSIYSLGITPHFNPLIQTQIYLGVIVNSYLLGLLAGKAHTGSMVLGLLDAILTATIATITLLVGGLL